MLSISTPRLRLWLWPHASKDFNCHAWPHLGHALRFARKSKRIPMWKLGWATGLGERYIGQIEKGFAVPTEVEHSVLRQSLGVSLRKKNFAKMDKVP
ncbi:unnamed protein product [Amoebophrya sp. A120]|nr:unnamed protein product [Amoebophrya sp. A120]|eukprot:GSA120T00008027001.1